MAKYSPEELCVRANMYAKLALSMQPGEGIPKRILKDMWKVLKDAGDDLGDFEQAGGNTRKDDDVRIH